MKEIILFDIPIYRCSVNKYADEIKEIKDKHIRSMEAIGLSPMQSFDFPSWRYNEIVGWVNISIWNNRIRAEYWLVKQRIMKWLRRKEFQAKGKLFVHHLRHKNMSSVDIYNALRQKLTSSFEELFPKYYLDITTFDNIGPSLDWTELHKKTSNNRVQ